MKTRYYAWLTGAALAAACVSVLAASPFVGSRSEPHGVLQLGEYQRAQQIWPVKIWAVDGDLTNRAGQFTLWIKPGEYTFKFKTGKVNMADVPGLMRSARFGDTTHALKLAVQAGTTYFIGAKFAASGDWEPVVWKTEPSKY
ncbi:MAG: hypothetical protein ACRETQ_05385 [Gammaproteobacteria bacterium]